MNRAQSSYNSPIAALNNKNNDNNSNDYNNNDNNDSNKNNNTNSNNHDDNDHDSNDDNDDDMSYTVQPRLLFYSGTVPVWSSSLLIYHVNCKS